MCAPGFCEARPIEFRPVDPINRFAKAKYPARQILWFRAVGALSEAQAVHQCVLAYASDMTLLDTSLLPHGFTLFAGALQTASSRSCDVVSPPLPGRPSGLLYVQESPSASGARGFNRGAIYRRDGVLVASVAQEGLIRLRPSIAGAVKE